MYSSLHEIAEEKLQHEMEVKSNNLLSNIKIIVTGSGVGMLALASPILAHAMSPPLIIISGFAPKKAGFHRTRSANFPTCREKEFNDL